MDNRSLGRRLGAAALVLVLFFPRSGRSENIDLSTVPDRETVQLTIYNSEDLTLVRETRKVSFAVGINPLQFSWAGTRIDPTSVELRFLSHPEKFSVLDATFPHDKPQMLYWNVSSDCEGEATVEISYFTSGISWSADYLAIADRDETQLGFEGFVRVTNRSGEDYDDAQVRLVVGTINLVEKIAQLAGVPVEQLSEVSKDRREELKKADLRFRFGNRVAGEKSAAANKPKEIIKEGLSEYFIYTIEGTETIPDGWSKRMRSFQGQTVPLRIQYRYRAAQYGDRLVRMYLWTNDEVSRLGTTPLPDGMVRVFRDNGRDGLSFLAAQPIKYVPIGDKIEINLGGDPEVIFELVKRRSWRDNLWLKITGTDKFRRIPEGPVQLNERGQIAGWDDHNLFAQRVRNYTSKPIDVEIRRSFGGHAVFRSELPARNHDYQTVEFSATVKPGEKPELKYELVTHQGHNAKQASVTVEAAAHPGD
jgi:hypothetical protein